MERLNNFDELKKTASDLKNKKSEEEKNTVIIKIAMATCSIASGSKSVMDRISEKMTGKPVGYRIVPTGCTGLCHSEPTVEVKLPGSEPVMFGPVNGSRADEIVDEYIMKGRIVDCVIEGK